MPAANVDTKFELPVGANTWTVTNATNHNAAGTGPGNRTGCGIQYALDQAALEPNGAAIIECAAGVEFNPGQGFSRVRGFC